mgnify:CR=1 FL=1
MIMLLLIIIAIACLLCSEAGQSQTNDTTNLASVRKELT